MKGRMEVEMKQAADSTATDSTAVRPVRPQPETPETAEAARAEKPSGDSLKVLPVARTKPRPEEGQGRKTLN